jgi:hypothetical protein
LGTTTASAVTGLLLATMSTTVSGHVVPSRTAFTTVLLTAASAALLALVIAAFIPRRRLATTADPLLATPTAVQRHEPRPTP